MIRPIWRRLFLVILVSFASLAQAAEFQDATEDISALGAAGYWTEQDGPKHRVEFVGSRGESVAIVELDIANPASIRARVSGPRASTEELSFVWDQVHGVLRLWTPGSLEPLESHYDFQKGIWEGDHRIQAAGARYSREIGFAALALDAAMGRGAELETGASQATCSPSSAVPGDELSTTIYCDGVRCRGFGTGGGASACCEEAWQDASHCCTNGVCWGCCRFLACDRGCAIGDYICFCGVTGVSCSYPDY